MKRKSIFLKALVLSVFVFVAASASMANIWMDENFDGASQFVQGDGQGVPANATLDVYDEFPPLSGQVSTSPLVNTGAVVSTKAFNGANSYEIETGESLGAGALIDGPGNGNYQVLQLAVNVDPIPAAGTVGEIRYIWDTDTTAGANPDTSFFVRLVSDGAKVDIVAGEDVAGSSQTTIDALTATTEWRYITLCLQDDALVNGAQPYTNAVLPGGQLNLTPQMAFYSSSDVAGASVAFTALNDNGANKSIISWSVSATGGTIYVDDVYWEGAMDIAAITSNIRAFNTGGTPPSAVSEWSLY